MTTYKTFSKLFIIFLLGSPFIGISQSQDLTCSDLKEGVFYSYPKNSADHSVFIRAGEYQKETDKKTGDTSLWKVNWLNDCTYSLQYISGNKKMTSEVNDFVQVHKLVIKIEVLSNDFYTYKTYIDKASGKFVEADTMWLQEKLNVADNTLFEQIPNNASLKKIHFTDTSSYAILYVYRPGKYAGRNGEYLLYFDDNIMCISKNRCAYTFKILREGTFGLSAKLFNQKEIKEKIDIKFGKKYYLKAGLKFVGTTGSGWRPDILVVNEEKGNEEFFEAQ